MTSTRDFLPALRIRAFKLTAWTRLAIPAMVLVILFGLVAFLMLVWRDRGHRNVMVNEQIAPARQLAGSIPLMEAGSANGVKAGPVKTAASDAPVITPPITSGNAGRNEFTLNKTNSTFTVGPVRLRLLRTNLNRKTYDLSVLARRRALVHRNLRAGQPVWIARNRGEPSVEVVVGSIGKESISGYWEEPDRPGQDAARNRNHP